MTIAVLMTSYNRFETTKRGLDDLLNQELESGMKLEIFLTDESNDGTYEKLRSQFRNIHLFHGDGSLYWVGAMRKSFEEAQKINPDFILFLNDDLVLESNAILKLFNTYRVLSPKLASPPIVVAAFRDQKSEKMLYGGRIRSSYFRPVNFKLAGVFNEPIACDTFNANMVLLCRRTAEKVGNFSAEFVHTMADFDYGLRAKKAGITVWQAPGFCGVADRNERLFKDTPRFKKLSELFAAIDKPFGVVAGGVYLMTFSEWKIFCKRHAGILWWFFWFWPYRRLWRLI